MATRDTIVIGASAGGVQALITLVAALPRELPAAVFIVLHTPADSPGLLPVILARESYLRIDHAKNGELIKPGRIYVAPPDQHLLIEGSIIRLVHGPKENLHRPSIDTLFRSAARWAGPRVIGVVLTGARDDGTVGMRAIKQRGGIAIVQDPRGYLFLGKAETARPIKATFQLVNKKWKIYRCLGGPLGFSMDEFPVEPNETVMKRLADGKRKQVSALLPNPLDLAQSEVEITQLRRISDTILRYTNVAVVIIDPMYRIVTINAAARRLLAVRDIAHDQDFLHAVRGLPYQEVRRAIDVAFHEHSTITLPYLALDESEDGTGRYIHLTIMIMQVEQGAPELAIITALDITEQEQLKRRMEAVQREQAELVGALSRPTNASAR